MWYAVYTKPKKEDSVAFLLQNIGIKILYPKIRFNKYKKNKFIEVIEPLFPCYLFASFEKEKYSHLIKYTRGVRYVVGKGNPVAVHEEIISAMKQGMEDDNIIAVKPQRFDKGDRVFIKDGPSEISTGYSKERLEAPKGQ
jgi:transcriptional antiterminator RfaH